MKPIASFPAETARRIVCILTDIDDTLTTDGQLPAASYAALESSRAPASPLFPSPAGRPAGAT